MRLDTSQQLRLSQEMKLSPRIIQAMEILQLPLLALQERIDAELVSNPVLEVQENAEGESGGEYERTRGETQMVVDEDRGHREDFQRLDDMTDEFGPDFANDDAPMQRPRPSDDGRDAKLEAMANTPAPGESLQDHLLNQWAFLEPPAAVDRAGRIIIEYIEDDGYLRTPLEELMDKTSCEQPAPGEQDFREALTLVQTLEPLGVGARDLRECLLIQLAGLSQQGYDVALETQLVGQFLREIEMNRLPAIAKRLDRDIEQIKEAIANIARLNPRPGSLISAETAPIVTPDVIVDLDEDGNVIVIMADERVPTLTINEQYSQQARDRNTEKETRKFLQRNIRSAEWIIEAIAQRRRTVLRVTEQVFRVQKDFLTEGREALKPLPMADVAEKVGVHVATVSRAVADKYVQTPRGIFPLRMFFSGGTTTASGEEMSWDAVKARLKELVDGEDKSKPLSDDALAEALKSEGIDIARRTVAKYRGLMNIPPARKRRQY
jgi:RNA polymerase sigma-54 factor